MQNYIYCNAIPIILLSTVVNGILYLTAELHQRKYYLSGIQASKQDQRAFVDLARVGLALLLRWCVAMGSIRISNFLIMWTYYTNLVY